MAEITVFRVFRGSGPGIRWRPADLVSTWRDLCPMLVASMNRIPAIAMSLAATALAANAAPRFALIRVTEIYSGLASTTTLQQEIKKELEEIMKNERAEELRKIIAELQDLQAKLTDKAKPLDEATNRKLARSYEIKRQEAQTLQKEFENYKAEEEKRINAKMVAGMRDTLRKITETSHKVAKDKGFQCVFDSSGSTNTGVPFVLYSKDSPDLTEDVKTALQGSGTAAATTSPQLPTTTPKH
jgi:Skp family chaperone for outer membrane proteins